MSQPCNRNCDIKQPGALDAKLGEFWVGNPWEIITEGHNLSAFERNRMYLNVGGREFLDVSHISGTDSDGDGLLDVYATAGYMSRDRDKPDG